EFRRLVDVIHEANSQSLLRGNHFSGQADFVGGSLAAKPREPLRTAIARQDTELYFRLPKLRHLAGQAHRAGQRDFASAAEREAIDGRDRRFSYRLQQM